MNGWTEVSDDWGTVTFGVNADGSLEVLDPTPLELIFEVGGGDTFTFEWIER